jgi:enoyl-CoA hydratase/carnithine racemase
MPAGGDLIRVDVENGVAVVVVDNPPVNSLSNAVLDALAATAERLAGEPQARVVILTGAGDKAFVAGADLDEFSAALGDTDWIEDHTSRSRRALTAWERLPQPVVGAVQASAVGGGLELALVCDLIVADAQARFGLPEVRLGLIPGAGGTQRLPRRIGLGPATEWMLLGGTVDAQEAQRLGLVNRVAAAGEALAEARALAERLAALPQGSLRAIKAALEQVTQAAPEGLDRERALFMDVFGSDDAREGVAAFREKRKPQFGHRRSGLDER